MSKPNVAVIYYSSTGGNTQMARWAAEAAKEAGAEVRLVKAHELAPDVAIDSNPIWRKNVTDTADIPDATSVDLEWADAIIFSSPSRFDVMASQLKQFIDLQGGLWAAGKLANKAVTAMATAGNPHGGQEEVIQSIYTLCNIGVLLSFQLAILIKVHLLLVEILMEQVQLLEMKAMLWTLKTLNLLFMIKLNV